MAFIEMQRITKSFPGVRALDDVSVSVERGEIHAIVGENGAGKSTLMKILGGLYVMDSGKIMIDGKRAEIRSIADSQNAGISVIYQELNLMPALTVAENIYVSDLPGAVGAVNYPELNRKTKELIDSLGLDIRSTDTVSMLSVSQRQMVEILKAVSHNAGIIIMDEPTAALNTQEVETLYSIIHKLKDDGKTILYISHRMREIFDLSDRVSVLRDGRYVGTWQTAELDEQKLVSYMVGREVGSMYTYEDVTQGEELLRVENLCKEGSFSDVSFSLRAGEIVGMAGLMGCGREEIVKAVYGLLKYDSGRVVLHGSDKRMKKPAHAIRRGLGFVTEDRKDSGIFGLMTVRENVTINILRVLRKFGLVSAKGERDTLAEYTKTMNIKYAGERQRIMFLSGGNQQKLILARALATKCDALILLEPTRGIDVGAKAEIYALLSEFARSGMGVLVASSELPEIMSVCHRTLVIYEGHITGNIAHSEMDENLIMRCATGSETYYSEGVAK